MTLKHGMSGTKLYRVWVDMKSRCCNPKDTGYKNWGGRGIKVCPEWDKPEPFLEWAKDKWQEGLELDRIDNNADYSPNNCRFVSKSINNLNRRTRADNSSGCSGVGWSKQKRKWRSRISIGGKEHHLGFFDDIEDAIKARQQAEHTYKAMIAAAQGEDEDGHDR